MQTDQGGPTAPGRLARRIGVPGRRTAPDDRPATGARDRVGECFQDELSDDRE